MDLEVNEARLFSIGGEPLLWWIDYRARYEPVGRIKVVTASIGGDLLRVQCDDREHANWLLEHAVSRGIPKSALKLKRPDPCGNVVNPVAGNGDENEDRNATGIGPLATTRQALSSGPHHPPSERNGDQHMTLGTFTPRTRITGDKIDLRQQQWYGRPMLMRCNEYSDSFSSKMQNGKMVEAVWVDVVDLASGTILINCLFTSGAIVDNLKEHAGTEVTLPVKISKQAGGKFGGYAVLEALTEAEQAQAGQWYQQYWGLVDQERAKREAAARPLQNQAPGGFNPAQGQQGFAPAAQAAPPQQFAQPTGQNQWPSQQGFPPAQGQAPAAQQPLPHDQGQFQQAGNPGQYVDPNAGQFAQPQGQQFQQPAPATQPPGAPHGQVNSYDQQMQAQGGQFAQPGQPTQGFGQVSQGGQPGMFTDAPPPVDPNQGFQAPNAQNMLAQLNNQLQ